MTLPTKEEAKRAAETLDRARGAVMFNGRAHDAFDLAITLLKAYAEGELVEREKTEPEPKFPEQRHINWHKVHDDKIIAEPYGNICLELERDPVSDRWMAGVYDDGTILFESKYRYRLVDDARACAERELRSAEKLYRANRWEFST